jgi:hypothetical protein
MYAGNYSTITNNLKVSPDASSTIFGTLSSDQSSTILTYESYDLFPAGLIVNSKNPNGDIDFCFNAASTDLSGLNSLFPATDTTSWWTIHTINDFYSMVLKNTVDNSTQIEVYVRSKVQKGSDLRFSTNNSYDVKSFYETVASGAPCNR